MSRTCGRLGGWAVLLGAVSGGLLAGALLVAVTPVPLSSQDAERGRELYDRWCAGCHGETGDGNGEAAAFMLPRPRDFTRAIYQIRSTASGEIPTDDDLRRVIDEGMPGTAMPGWRDRLTPGERDDVIAYLKAFSRYFGDDAPQRLEFGRPPAESDEGLAEGRRVYDELECFKCHGTQGRGDGPSAPTQTDDWDFPIRPADLTRRWAFNGGGSVEQIHRRLRTGLDGTPMPSFSDVIDAGIITDEQLWQVAQYVASLGPEQPRIREVVRAARVDTLPAGPTDGDWDMAEPFYVPLVGQIVERPRWFTPTVTGMWIRAVHDGQRMALRLSWSDPSASPDSAWQDWLTLIAATVQDHDGPVEPVQGPDLVTLQFPAHRPRGMVRPYFLGGDPKRPTHVWRWRSAPDQLQVGSETGLGTFAPVSTTEVAHVAVFADGQWQLQVSRALIPADTSAAPAFAVGEAIPVAFRAADGSSGEDDVRGSVSAWYALYLDVPTPPRVFVTPAVAAVLTVALGLFVVVRAQRRERDI